MRSQAWDPSDASTASSLRIWNALTFDVEEYFHAEVFTRVVRPEDWEALPSRAAESTRRILDVLDLRGITATFFVLGWVAERDPGLVKDIQARGHEIACHSYAHRLIYGMTQDDFRADVRRAKAVIEDATGSAVVGYRAPTFSVTRQTLWALGVLAEEGFRYDSSVFPIHHDRYGIPDAPRFPHRVRLVDGRSLIEFPITTLAIAGQRFPFSGGGYFRLLPYPVIRAALRRVNTQERMPGIVYLHPWELDPEQPRLPIRGLSRVRHYANLERTAGKLDQLLSDFKFAPVAHLLEDTQLADVAVGQAGGMDVVSRKPQAAAPMSHWTESVEGDPNP